MSVGTESISKFLGYDATGGPVLCDGEDALHNCPTVSHDVTWTQQYGTGRRTVTQIGVIAPKWWSARAVKIVTEKYFSGELGTPERETSVLQLIRRVSNRIMGAVVSSGYLKEHEALWFRADLEYLLIHQKFSFNSPVWFNVGVEGRPQQTSACFIVPISDSLESILDTNATFAKLFKSGSGVGTNYSSLRSSLEGIGGSVNTASGPVSFMRAHDAFGGTMKSGGATRRSASMRLMDDTHPDLVEFIESKVHTERAAHALVDAGVPAAFDDPYSAYGLMPFASANHSVRLTDEFMRQVTHEGPTNGYALTRVTDGTEVARVAPSAIMDKIASAAWECGDPGVQFSDTINAWHTCYNDGPIRASNPCSEYVFLDDTSCNLGSLNLLSFIDAGGVFLTDRFIQAVRVAIVAMDALIEFSDYPTDAIARGSREYRTLGLGFTNLGAALMNLGVAYDSTAARKFAGAVTSLMSSVAYATSASIAATVGAFPGFDRNRSSMSHVLDMHYDAACEALAKGASYGSEVPTGAERVLSLQSAAMEVQSASIWDDVRHAVSEGRGLRNAQVTVLAPTGTISFMMDCDTTGIEPEFAMLKWKTCVGGDVLATVNPCVKSGIAAYVSHMKHGALTPENVQRVLLPRARHMLQTGVIDMEDTLDSMLIVADDPLDAVVSMIQQHQNVTDVLIPEVARIFTCATTWGTETQFLSSDAHLLMMSACQPFLSGAISKTVNVPHSATKEQIRDIYVNAYQLGLKCVAVYRDGCKASQPLATVAPGSSVAKESHVESVTHVTECSKCASAEFVPSVPRRKVIPADLPCNRHSVTIGGTDIYIHIALHDGAPVEVFLTAARVGSTMHGLLSTVGILVSQMLRSGAFTVQDVARMLQGLHFAPNGFTTNQDVPSCRSIPDYLARLLLHYDSGRVLVPHIDPVVSEGACVSPRVERYDGDTDAPRLTGNICHNCGGMTQRSGTCDVCVECGTTTGCG